MYRYSQHVRDGMGVNRTQKRVLSMLCLVLMVAVIVLGILYARSGTFQSNYESLRLRRMQSEASQALSEYKSLSTTGGTTTAATLGRIRQHVYAIESMEELHAGLSGAGSRIIDESMFDEVDSWLDKYNNKLQMGQSVQEEQAALLVLLEQLTAMTQQN